MTRRGGRAAARAGGVLAVAVAGVIVMAVAVRGHAPAAPSAVPTPGEHQSQAPPHTVPPTPVPSTPVLGDRFIAVRDAASHQLVVSKAGGDLPTGATVIAMAADPKSGRLLATSCCAEATAAAPTLAWDGATWRPVATTVTPLYTAGLASDPVVTDTDDGHLLLLGSVAQPVQGNPQPVHLWRLSGSTWVLAG